jgi:hypothetical protein
MRKIDISLTNGGQSPIIHASIDDPLLALFVVAGLVIALIVLFSLAVIGFRFLCLIGVCDAFRSC